MEKYAVSRELAEKLKAAGYPQNSVCYFYGDDFYINSNIHDYSKTTTAFGAPMSDELLEQLPKLIEDGNRFMFDEFMGKWRCGYGGYGDMYSESFDSEKPADALAELWLWCKLFGHLS